MLTRWKLPPRNVLLVEAQYPLVQTGGYREVREDFYDNDRVVSKEAAPYYDFIAGEPYAVWS
jgi:hypothetical protein